MEDPFSHWHPHTILIPVADEAELVTITLDLPATVNVAAEKSNNVAHH